MPSTSRPVVQPVAAATGPSSCSSTTVTPRLTTRPALVAASAYELRPDMRTSEPWLPTTASSSPDSASTCRVSAAPSKPGPNSDSTGTGQHQAEQEQRPGPEHEQGGPGREHLVGVVGLLRGQQGREAGREEQPGRLEHELAGEDDPEGGGVLPGRGRAGEGAEHDRARRGVDEVDDLRDGPRRGVLPDAPPFLPRQPLAGLVLAAGAAARAGCRARRATRARARRRRRPARRSGRGGPRRAAATVRPPGLPTCSMSTYGRMLPSPRSSASATMVPTAAGRVIAPAVMSSGRSSGLPGRMRSASSGAAMAMPRPSRALRRTAGSTVHAEQRAGAGRRGLGADPAALAYEGGVHAELGDADQEGEPGRQREDRAGPDHAGPAGDRPGEAEAAQPGDHRPDADEDGVALAGPHGTTTSAGGAGRSGRGRGRSRRRRRRRGTTAAGSAAGWCRTTSTSPCTAAPTSPAARIASAGVQGARRRAPAAGGGPRGPRPRARR